MEFSEIVLPSISKIGYMPKACQLCWHGNNFVFAFVLGSLVQVRREMRALKKNARRLCVALTFCGQDFKIKPGGFATMVFATMVSVLPILGAIKIEFPMYFAIEQTQT